MFSQLQILVSGIISWLYMIWDTVLHNWGYIGVSIIGFPILRKIGELIKKLI